MISYIISEKIILNHFKTKEPYLKRNFDSYKTNSNIENKYNASDILTILENIFDELRLNESRIINYDPKKTCKRTYDDGSPLSR